MGNYTHTILIFCLLIGVTSGVQAGGTETLDETLLGVNAGSNLDTSDAIGNTFIGANAGKATTIQNRNTFVGDKAGESNTGFNNTFIGFNAGANNTLGDGNLFIGDSAGLASTVADRNTFIGAGSGAENIDGEFNTFVGKDAGASNTGGDRNTFVGEEAGLSNTTGLRNTFIGENAGISNTDGLNNTLVGEGAGFNATGDNNVFLGFRAGEDETGSDRLYIESSNSSAPLLYGEFDNDLLAVNGILGVGTQLPTAPLHVRRSDGTANLLVEEANATAAPRQLYTLENNGPVAFGLINNDLGQEWRFAAQTSGFRISLGGSGGQEFEVGNDGTLAVGPAGTQNLFLDTSGNLTIEGTLTEMSSRSVKEDVEPVDSAVVLERLSQLELSRWRYEGQTAPHLGPMAEDFHALYGLGADGRHIAPKDLAGVALVSAQALDARTRQTTRAFRAELRRKEARIQRLEAKLEQRTVRLEKQNTQLRASNKRLRHRVDALARQVGRLAASVEGDDDKLAVTRQ